jgi:putative tryptophan/tyrosine transport system substrate-binding protein
MECSAELATDETVEAGGLASLRNARENYRRAATYVDKILKGAKAGDLPIEFPTKVVLAINLKIAKTLGTEVPLHLQQLVDDLIE